MFAKQPMEDVHYSKWNIEKNDFEKREKIRSFFMQQDAAKANEEMFPPYYIDMNTFEIFKVTDHQR